MADLNNLVVVAGAVLPAFYTARNRAEYPDTYLHRFAYSTILGLLVAIVGTFSCFNQYLTQPVPWVLARGAEINGYHYLALLISLMVVLDLLFGLFASKITNEWARRISILILVLLALCIATHALLLHNTYRPCPQGDQSCLKTP